MKIKILYGYRGKNTREQYIPVGEYDASNPILHGQAKYLIDNGHAVIVEDVKAIFTPDTDDTTLDTEPPLSVKKEGEKRVTLEPKKRSKRG